MDSLLTYLLYRVTVLLIGIEVLIMVVCSVSIVFIKLFTRWKAKGTESTKSGIADLINKELFSKAPIEDFKIPSNLLNFRDLVEEVEEFDHRFTDKRWYDIKERIFDLYLRKTAERKSKSWYWLNRQLAARAFLLCPQKTPEEDLKRLLHDSKYLVRIVAAVCITKTSFKNLFFDMINVMSKETKLSQFPYRDALVDIDQQKFKWLEELLSTTTNPSVKAICLDILSTRVTADFLHLLRPYFKSDDRECRILAIKALGNIPSQESLDILMDHLEDSDWELRAISIGGLHKLHATRAIPKLRELLNDPIWWVRLQAALTLKDFGEEGVKILKTQDEKATPAAFEIAQYTLALP